jgi:hypothetical protein
MSDSPQKAEMVKRSAPHDNHKAVRVMIGVKIIQLPRALKTNIFFQLQDIAYFSKQGNDVGLQIIHAAFRIYFADAVSSASALAYMKQSK